MKPRVDATSRLVKSAKRTRSHPRRPLEPEHRGNRYKRSDEARRAVLHAVDDLLVEVGFTAMSIEGIAARAGVGKQTIYRWWRSKTDVLMEAFLSDSADVLEFDSSDDAGQDLRRRLATVADFLSRSDAAAMFRALTAEALHDPNLAARLRSEFFEKQREVDRTLIRRCAACGVLTSDTDVELALDRLLGPIYYRLLVTGEPVNKRFTNSLVLSLTAADDGRRPA